MNEETKRSIYIYWNIIQPEKGRKEILAPPTTGMDPEDVTLNRPDVKGQILYVFTCVRDLQKPNLWRQKVQ